MKPLHVGFAIVFVVCGGLLIFGGNRAPDPVVEAAPRASRDDATPATASTDGVPLVSIAALRSRKELFGNAGSGPHDLFGSQSWMPPLPSVAPASAQIPPLPPLPMTPSVPFTYIGKKAANGMWEVYLARGDETVIVHDNSMIDANYRVDSIRPPTLTLMYLPLRQVQTIDIGDAD
ncbi:hypothetical protein [Paraburkholderia humisilvae]|uniref:Secretion system X translation initiation factor n=1 Tax=Paraburkholderia humisilvae TaxID=627669 RepID=A0A6J5EXA8_9BURK|nr:hypothetical protein [Paraburkholderia humisilvae]CAB3769685.1 hypothetical protein LMG29542_06179 [Paraburkholderia humisilvae]